MDTRFTIVISVAAVVIYSASILSRVKIEVIQFSLTLLRILTAIHYCLTLLKILTEVRFALIFLKKLTVMQWSLILFVIRNRIGFRLIASK